MGGFRVPDFGFGFFVAAWGWGLGCVCVENRQGKAGAAGRGGVGTAAGRPPRLLEDLRSAAGVCEDREVPARRGFAAQRERVDAHLVGPRRQRAREDDLLVALAIDHALGVRVEEQLAGGVDLGLRIGRVARAARRQREGRLVPDVVGG